MAKGNMLLGLARGSVGDITFYRRNSQQISRVRVRKVKNPQSTAQMYQRAINRTAVQAYGVLKEICNHSYEGVSYGANSYSKFLSLNMDMLRWYLANETDIAYQNKAYVPAGFEGLSAMPYIVSQGSLRGIANTAGLGYEFVSFSPSEGVVIDSSYFILLDNVYGGPHMTYKSFADALGAKQGDQITILKVHDPASVGYPDEPLGRDLELSRFILDPGSGNDWAETEFFIAVSGVQGAFRINDPNPRNEGNPIFAIEPASSGIGNEYKISTFGESVSDVPDFAYAGIVSRQKADGSWMRSTALLSCNHLFRENGYTIKQASILTPTEVVIESDYYLNNAEGVS